MSVIASQVADSSQGAGVEGMEAPRLGRVLRAVVAKDLRQNWVYLALVLLVDFIALMLYEWVSQAELMYRLSGEYDNVLLRIGLEGVVIFGCALAALLIGVFQPLSEMGFDSWSFQVHRPVSRKVLFLGRVLAGMILYFVVAGIPLIGLFVYAATGEQGVGFFWRYMLPPMADFVAAFAFYFVGLLITDRRALVYGSRLAPLVLGVLSLGLTALPWFWAAVGGSLAVTAVLAVAAMGASESHGYTLQEQAPKRRALTVVLFVAFTLLIAPTGVWQILRQLSELPTDCRPQVREDSGSESSSHFLLPDGSLGTFSAAGYQDAEGHRLPAMEPISRQARFRGVFSMASGQEHFRDLLPIAFNFTQGFSAAKGRELERWEFDTAAGIFFIYHLSYPERTPQENPRISFVGTLGVDGFVAPPHRAKPFGGFRSVRAGVRLRLTTTEALYDVDMIRRTATSIFKPPPGEAIVGANEYYEGEGYVDPATSELYRHMVATTQHLYELKPTGEVLKSFPIRGDWRWQQLYVTAYPQLKKWQFQYMGYSFLSPRTRYSAQEFYDDDGKLLAADGSTYHFTSEWPTDLKPELAAQMHDAQWKAGVVTAIGNPVAIVAIENLALAYFQNPWEGRSGAPMAAPASWRSALACGVLSLCSAVITYFVGTWYGLRTRMRWTVLALLTGSVAILTLVSVHGIPRRARCPACRKRRMVGEEECPRCRAKWPEPGRTGTEVFAGVGE